MKLSELPQKERELAEKLRAENIAKYGERSPGIDYDPDNLKHAFLWGPGKEDFLFWDKWHNAPSPS